MWPNRNRAGQMFDPHSVLMLSRLVRTSRSNGLYGVSNDRQEVVLSRRIGTGRSWVGSERSVPWAPGTLCGALVWAEAPPAATRRWRPRRRPPKRCRRPDVALQQLVSKCMGVGSQCLRHQCNTPGLSSFLGDNLAAEGIDEADLADVSGHGLGVQRERYRHPPRRSFEAIREAIG